MAKKCVVFTGIKSSMQHNRDKTLFKNLGVKIDDKEKTNCARVCEENFRI